MSPLTSSEDNDFCYVHDIFYHDVSLIMQYLKRQKVLIRKFIYFESIFAYAVMKKYIADNYWDHLRNILDDIKDGLRYGNDTFKIKIIADIENHNLSNKNIKEFLE